MDQNLATDTEENSLNIAPSNWENPPTLSDLKEDYESGKQSHREQVYKINNWLDNMHVRGSAKPKKRAGYSETQPKLIRKQAEWKYPDLKGLFGLLIARLTIMIRGLQGGG